MRGGIGRGVGQVLLGAAGGYRSSTDEAKPLTKALCAFHSPTTNTMQTDCVGIWECCDSCKSGWCRRNRVIRLVGGRGWAAYSHSLQSLSRA